MIGVVLWADQADHKAVIWCEDHGNLAFIKSQDMRAMDATSLDAGDVIQFELEHDFDAQLRLAAKPKMLARGEFPRLATLLTSEAMLEKNAPNGSIFGSGRPVIKEQHENTETKVVEFRRKAG